MLWFHDDVNKWIHFSRYWPFVRGIHQSPVDSPHKGKWRRALMFSFDLRLSKRLSEQSWCWWFETPSRSLWRHGNVLILRYMLFWYFKSGSISLLPVLYLGLLKYFATLRHMKTINNTSILQDIYLQPLLYMSLFHYCNTIHRCIFPKSSICGAHNEYINIYMTKV